MDYPLAISPELKIDPSEFAVAWNQDELSKSIAQAHVAPAAKGSYPLITPDVVYQGLVFLAGVAGTVALDAVKDVVKERIKNILTGMLGSDPAPQFEVIVINPGDKPMIIVKPKQA